MTAEQTFLISTLLIFVLWSAIMLGLRQIAKPVQFDRNAEMAILALMLSPILTAPISLNLTPLPFDANIDWSWGELQLSPSNPDEAVTKVPESKVAPDIPLIINFTLISLMTVSLVKVIQTVGRIQKIIKANKKPFSNGPAKGVYISNDISTAILALNGKIIIPNALLKQSTPKDLDLILLHEEQHFRNRDHLVFPLLAVLDALFWFNPFFKTQSHNCRRAAELDCDAKVIAEKPEMRREYAKLLVSSLKHTAGNALPCAPAAFSPRNKGDHRMRIESILTPKPKLGKALRNQIIGLLAIGLIPVFGLQWATANAENNTTFLIYDLPVDGRITSNFGLRVDPFTKQKKRHSGMDIGAPMGTPVKSPVAGIVVFAEKKGAYGNLIVVDHGNGYQTRYAQLDEFSVKKGETVRKGQTIGKVGQSGRATGPHLHFEVLHNDEQEDPQAFIVQ